MNRRDALRALFVGAPAAGLAMVAAPAMGYHSGGYVGEIGPELVLPKPKGTTIGELKITISDADAQRFTKLMQEIQPGTLRVSSIIG